jgi:predicted enzyme related to lactoylglutathione lyase
VGARESHDPGIFSWVELLTSDAEGAKAFYARVFGWEYDDMPVGDGGGTYSMAKLGDRYVGALFQSDRQPPAWGSYVTVTSADEAAERAMELGATVMQGPFDVFDAGRMAVIGDPQGAVFAMWQPNRHIGAGLVNAPGALTWNELLTSDVAAAEEFYGGLFGWTSHVMEDMGGYHVIQNAGRWNGGISALAPEMGDLPPQWSVSFGCEDVDRTVAEAEQAGGGVVVPGTQMGELGRFAVLTDPQGASFAVYTGLFDD